MGKSAVFTERVSSEELPETILFVFDGCVPLVFSELPRPPAAV